MPKWECSLSTTNTTQTLSAAIIHDLTPARISGNRCVVVTVTARDGNEAARKVEERIGGFGYVWMVE